MYFEQNAEALLKNSADYRVLIESLRAADPVAEDDILLVSDEDGQCRFRYQNIWLHAAENPLEEVKRVFEATCKPKADHAHLIIGMGLGYALDEAVLNSPSPTIIVYEPDLSLLRFTFENVVLAELLVNSRVHLVTTQSDLMKLAMTLIYAYYQLDFLVLPGFAQRMASELLVIAENIRTIMVDWTRNYHTERRFHKLWMSQFFQNLPHYPDVDGLDALSDCFAGKQAIIIGRGPSLDNAMEDIVALQQSAVLVAVGAALRHLWQAGVIPDFAVFVDANALNEQLHGLPEDFLNQVVFIIAPYLQPDVFNYPARAKLLLASRSTKHVSDWLDQALNTRQGRLEAGGTVSLFALQLALYMGCTDLVLIGQDLAMPNNQVYAGGIELQTDGQGNMVLTSTETLYAESEPMTTIMGQDGQIMPTLKSYSTFARQFVELGQKVKATSPQIRLYNASLGGAHLEGYELIPLSQFRTRWTPWKTGLALSNAPTHDADATHQRARLLSTALTNLQLELRETSRLCETLIACLQAKNSTQLAMTRAKPSSRPLEERLWECASQWVVFLQGKPFVAFLLMFDVTPLKQRLKTYRDETTFQPEMAQDFVDSLHQLIATLNEDYGQWADASRLKLEQKGLPVPK